MNRIIKKSKCLKEKLHRFWNYISIQRKFGLRKRLSDDIAQDGKHASLVEGLALKK